jgi:hypothetical protein
VKLIFHRRYFFEKQNTLNATGQKPLIARNNLKINTLQKDQAESNAKEVQLCPDYNP